MILGRPGGSREVLGGFLGGPGGALGRSGGGPGDAGGSWGGPGWSWEGRGRVLGGVREVLERFRGVLEGVLLKLYKPTKPKGNSMILKVSVASWRVPGASRGGGWGRPGGLLGTSWRFLGASWGVLETSWGVVLGGSWGVPGGLGGVLGPPGAVLGRLGAHRGRLGAFGPHPRATRDPPNRSEPGHLRVFCCSLAVGGTLRRRKSIQHAGKIRQSRTIRKTRDPTPETTAAKF